MMMRNIRPIELRHLFSFMIAAEQGSFRKAGAALGISQSAISRRIATIEDQLGVSLFHRQPSGVSLTHAGERLLPQARQGLRAIEEGTQALAPVGRGEEGILKVGIFSSLACGFLSDLLIAYDSKHPKVRVHFVDGDSADHVAAIRRLSIDVAFVAGRSAWSDCETAHLWSERVFAVLPDGHPLADRKELAWTDLANEMFIVSNIAPGPAMRDCLIQRLANHSYRPNIQVQHVGQDNLFRLVAMGRGLTLTSEATIAAQIPGASFRPIAGEVLPFSAVWSSRNDNPAFRRLLSLARSKALANKRSVPLASDTRPSLPDCHGLGGSAYLEIQIDSKRVTPSGLAAGCGD